MTTTPPPAAQRVAAFFDLDGTLIPGSSVNALAKAAVTSGFVSKRDLALDAARTLALVLRGARGVAAERLRDRVLRGITGRRAAEVEALAEDIIADLVATMPPTMRELVAEHRAAGHHLVLVSASPTEVVHRVAEAAGLDRGIGTTARRDADDRYDGTLVGPFCHREGKAQLVAALAAEHGFVLAECFGYSDSASDEPLLAMVGHPVAVDPEPELHRLAEARGWPVIDTGPRARGIPGLREAIRAQPCR